MNFWGFETWTAIIQLGILLTALLFSNILRRKITFIRKSLIPTSVIAGIVVLVLKETGLLSSIVDKNYMEIITYHALGLGFISIALKKGTQSKDQKRKNFTSIFDSGILTVSTYLLQGIIGLGITLLLCFTLMPNVFPASGLLLPLGFGQGSGQALNFGIVFQGYGFTGGADFGLSIAAIGFVFACLGGVIYMQFFKKKNMLKTARDSSERSFNAVEEVSAPDEIPLTESVDKFTIQIAFVIMTYFITYLFLYGISFLIDAGYLGNFGTNTLKPLLWGFNFLLGTIFAVLVKTVLSFLRKSKVMTRDYPNNFLLNRIGGFMFDLMIVSGIAAIELKALSNLFIPLAAICAVGGVITIWYVHKVCKVLFPQYPFEEAVAMFGMLLGTASTGMILLRELDPEFKTPASNNLVMQTIPAIIFGFPMLLLLGYAPKGLTQAVITFFCLIALVIPMNILLFRKQIFARKRGEKAPPVA